MLVPNRTSNYKYVEKFTASGSILDSDRTNTEHLLAEGKKPRQNWCPIGDISKAIFGYTWRAIAQMAASAPSARNETKLLHLHLHKTAAVQEHCDTHRVARANLLSTTAQSLTFLKCSLFTCLPHPAWRAFAKLRKVTIGLSCLSAFPSVSLSARLCLSVCLSVRPPACLSVRLSACPSVCLPVRPPVCLYVRASVSPSVCPSVYLSVCPSVRLSICPSVYLSVCLSVCLSIRLSARNNPAPTVMILIKFDIWVFLENL